MFDYIVSAYKTELIYIMRTLLAGICGLLVGTERARRQKEAGIRTHFIVACAAGLFTSVSISFDTDAARIAAQIIPGLGFLGAGIIFFRRESVHGLTTAAGIWATAGIGMALGCGLYILAFGSTIVIMVAQFFFHSKTYRQKNYQQLFLIKFLYSAETKVLLQENFKVKEFSRFKLVQENGIYKAEAVIRPRSIYSADDIAAMMMREEKILSIERLEDL